MSDEFDFYSKTTLKSYNLNETMRYQLSRLDTLDVFTRKHCENVASLVCRICEYLGLNPTFTVYCTTCAYLHDIGKMFIPHEILQKNAKLTPEEYKVMQTHALKGYEICINDPQLKAYANGALYHHEALDGSGYPYGVTIDDIPLEGQIIRVADEYDAIVNKRQYKSHIGISETLKILIENATPVPIQPNETLDKKTTKIRKKYGKVNKKIVKQLMLIIISDIKEEIDSIDTYVKHLKEQIDRLNMIGANYKKYREATSEQTKQEYYNLIQSSFAQGENLNNIKEIFDDYINAFNIRSQKIKDLYKEIDIIKNLKL